MGDVKKYRVSNKNETTNMKLPTTGSTSNNEGEKIIGGSSGSSVTFTTNTKVGSTDSHFESERRTRRGRHSTTIKSVNLTLNTELANKKPSSPDGPTAYLNSVMNTLVSENVSSPVPEKSSSAISQTSNGGSNSYKISQKRKNRNQENGNHHKPAEVFRKDLISAMKIPDTSQLLSEEYWLMKDSWRMEWEKGVQVPVNAEVLPCVKVDMVQKDARGDFRMPRKLIKTTPDAGDRDTVNLNVLADSTCRYDLDEVDVAWLQVINEERDWMGSPALDEFTMEIIMEELETQCHENMQLAIKTKEGLGIEYDENIVCDVCRSPDCEEGNEMVFCDGCNLCVHQACYGILKVPDGSWLCKPCALGIRGSAVCILCGKKNGAMKSTKSGRKWAHVSCALWIPEINIADPNRMEPITKVSHIPSSRWALVCTVCKERNIGACIQCSVRHCVTAYHVTCAMEKGFDMITDCLSPNSPLNTGESSIVFRSFCQKHSKNHKKKLENSPGKKSEEEKRSDRQKRIAEFEEEFYTLVRSNGVASALNISPETATQVLEYWKCKRKANFNRPLLTPKQEEGKALEEAAETGLQRRLRMFTHLRQDLERVRNLCYMIGKREKMKRSSVKLMSNVFLAQMHYVEYKMSQSPNFDIRALLPSLPRCGNAELLQRAKMESAELNLTPEWSQNRDESRSSSPRNIDLSIAANKQSEIELSSKNDDEIDVESDVPGRPRPLPKSSATVSQITSPKEEHIPTLANETSLLLNKDKDKRKNGLRTDLDLKSSTKIKHNFLEERSMLKKTSKKKGSESGELTESFEPIRQRRLRNSQDEDLQVKSPYDMPDKRKFDPDKDSIQRNYSKSEHNDKINNPHTDRHTNSQRDKHVNLKKQHTTSSDVEHNTVRNEARTSGKRSNQKHSDLSHMSISSSKVLKSLSKVGEEDINEKQEDMKQESSRKPHLVNKKARIDKQDEELHKIPRRSSRYLDSNSEESDVGREKQHDAGMTIITETIAETKRISSEEVSRDKTPQRKRTWSSTGDKSESANKIKKRRKDSQNIRVSKQKSKEETVITTMHQKISEYEKDSGRPHLRRSSQTRDNQRKSLFKSSLPSKKDQTSGLRGNTSSDEKVQLKHREAKNGQRALAPSQHDHVADVPFKNETGDTLPAHQTCGQELDDSILSFSLEAVASPKSDKLSNSDSDRSVSSKVIEKMPVFDIGETDSSWKAPGLDISYGSHCPAPLRRSRHAEKQTASSGLRWVSLISEENPKESLLYPPCSVTPKDQDGYRGDMDESDSDFQNGSSHNQHRHHRRLSKSRKRNSLNPGKHKTGIGILSTKASDSSEDDFDLSFPLHQTFSEKSRQKLRSISNTSPASSNSPLHTRLSVTEPKELNDPSSQGMYNKIHSPKNVKAVGGIQGGLKCEPDASPNLPFYSRATDGRKSQDNFFEKFAFLNESRIESPPLSQSIHENISSVQSQFASSRLVPYAPEQLPYRSHPMFPFGTIGPWQMSTSALPSIVPNLPAMPVYYQYPPPPPYRRDGSSSATRDEIRHPSPPPMPDSTLSPESFLPSSASVAVQASAESTKPVHTYEGSEATEKPMLSEKSHIPTNSPVDECENEWEVVAESVGEVQLDNCIDEQRRRRRKKKKKKKKKRKICFPDGYESDQKTMSSPLSASTLPDPTYGAIVPHGHSHRYDKGHNMKTPITSGSGLLTDFSKHTRRSPNSQSSIQGKSPGGISNVDSESHQKKHNLNQSKLVLKINKRNMSVARNFESCALDSQTSSKTGESPIQSSPYLSEDTVTSSSGLKLKIKKSILQFDSDKHFYKHREKHKHRSKDKHKFHDKSKDELPSSTSIIKSSIEKKPAALRRLGLSTNSIPRSDECEEGIGKKALRERKQIKPTENSANQSQLGREKHSDKKNEKDKSYSPPKLRRRESDCSTYPGSHKEKSQLAKRRGRPPKVQPPSVKSIPAIISLKQEASSELNKVVGHETSKDFAKFAGWSTKSSKHMKPAPRAIMSSRFFKPSAVGPSHRSSVDSYHQYKLPADISHNRSLSTDSDQASTASSNYNPARHWKKRKVQEHKLSEHLLPRSFPSESLSSPTKVKLKVNQDFPININESIKPAPEEKLDLMQQDIVTHSSNTANTISKTQLESHIPNNNPGDIFKNSKTFGKPENLKKHSPTVSVSDSIKESSSGYGILTPPSSLKSESSISPIKDQSSTNSSMVTESKINMNVTKSISEDNHDKEIPTEPFCNSNSNKITLPVTTTFNQLGLPVQSRSLSSFKIPKKYNSQHTESQNPDR